LKGLVKIFIILRNLNHLLFLYLKRGALKSFLYVVTLFAVSLTVGFLLESNAKMDAAVGQLNRILPANRFKAVIPQKIEPVKQAGVFSLFSKPQAQPRRKNFITPALLQKVKAISGIESAVGLISVDFPMGVEFSVPGSSSAFRAEVIGIGLHEKDARPFLAPRENFRPQAEEVPVLLASYLLEVFNVILQNNAVPFRLTEKTVLGMKFSLHIGESAFAASGSPLVSRRILCRVAGFIDLDYTYGIAFPSGFIDAYKKKFWQNFQTGYYDSLMLTLSLDDFDRTEKQLKALGFQVQEDTAVFKRVSRFVNDNKKMVSLFLSMISAVILVLGVLLCLYTVSFMLKDRGLEFSLYRFFGSSNFKIFALYGIYLTLLNLLALWISYQVSRWLLQKLGTQLLELKEHIPSGFQAILDSEFLLNPLVLTRFFSGAFLLLEFSLGILLAVYLAGLKKRL